MANISEKFKNSNILGGQEKTTDQETPAEELRLSSTDNQSTPYQAGKIQNPGQQGSATGQRFRNLKQYIDQSKGGMAEKIVSNIQRQEASVGEQIEQAKSKFDTTVTDERKRLTEEETKYATPEAATTNIIENAGTLVGNEGFKGLQSGQVADTTIAKAGDIGRSAAAVRERGTSLGTEGGRFQELQQRFGTGRRYGTGAQRLDQLILQTKKDERDVLGAARKDLGVGIEKEFSDLVGQEEAARQELGQRAGSIQSNIEKGISTGYEDLFKKATTGLEEFKSNPVYNQLLEQGFTNDEIVNFLKYQTKESDPTKEVVKPTTPTVKPIGTPTVEDQMRENLYNVYNDPTEIQNRLNPYLDELRSLSSNAGMLSNAEIETLNALSQLGEGSNLQLKAARDANIVETKSPEDIRREALTQITSPIVAAEADYNKTYDNYKKIHSEVDAKNNPFGVPTNLMSEYDNTIPLEEKKNRISNLAVKYGVDVTKDPTLQKYLNESKISSAQLYLRKIIAQNAYKTVQNKRNQYLGTTPT